MTKILSIRQPWAWLIVNGHKDIENRTWRTKHRGRFLVHAGLTMTKQDWLAGVETAALVGDELVKKLMAAEQEIKAQRGGIVGSANITDCVDKSSSPWFFGKHGFVLNNAKPLPFVPLKGRLGFFSRPQE